MYRWLLALVALVAFGWWQSGPAPRQHPPGMLAPAIPQQFALESAVASIERGAFKIQPLAHFSLTARVLSREDYSFGTESELSPIDLALGWGRMSDSAVLDAIDISQSGRFYTWRTANYPIPHQDIVSSSANMHLVPADAAVAHALQAVKEGDVVSLDGYLIEAVRSDGWRWMSSLTRDDSGEGACELIFVQSFSIRP